MNTPPHSDPAGAIPLPIGPVTHDGYFPERLRAAKYDLRVAAKMGPIGSMRTASKVERPGGNA